MSHKTNQPIRNKKSKEKEGKGKKKEKGKEKTEVKEEKYFDDIIDVDENTAKDFEFLINAPVSEDDHFVFKVERDWTVDVSKYTEFFTLDLKALSAAIESIPFNENVDIDKKYFTDDQLTNIYNNAQRGKEKYNKILNSLESKCPKDTKGVDETKDSLEEDLDFLLSLQEPISNLSLTVKPLPTSYNADSRITAGTSKASTSTKPLDLEKWLDSVLDD